MKRHRFAAVPGFLALLLSGCSLLSGAGLPDRTPELWSVSLDGFGPSVIHQNILVGFADRDGNGYRFTSVDLDKRKVVWASDEIKGYLFKKDMITNGTHWFLHQEDVGALEIYRVADGALANTLEYPMPSERNKFGLSPVIDGTTLYVGSGIYLYAFDIQNPEDPVLMWTLEAPSWLNALVVDDSGYLYIGVQILLGGTNIFKVDPRQGSVVWEATTYTDTVEEPADPESFLLDGSRLLVNASNTMQAFDTATGARVWLSEPLFCGSDGYAPGYVLEPGEDSVFFTSGACVMAVQRATGKVQWLFNSEVESNGHFTFSGKPTYYKGVVYAVNGRLWGLDAKTGKVLSFAGTKGTLTQSAYINVYNDQLLVWGRRLFSFKPVR